MRGNPRTSTSVVVVEAFLALFLFLAHLDALGMVGELRFGALGLHAKRQGQEHPFAAGFFRAGGLRRRHRRWRQRRDWRWRSRFLWSGGWLLHGNGCRRGLGCDRFGCWFGRRCHNGGCRRWGCGGFWCGCGRCCWRHRRGNRRWHRFSNRWWHRCHDRHHVRR